MIEIETRLLELLDWDEEVLESLYDKASRFLLTCKTSSKREIEERLITFLENSITEEGAKLIFSVLDQNIRLEMRVIEE